METAIESLGKVVVMSSSVIEEAAEELVGTSKRKWALVLVAFVLGGVAAVAFVAIEKRRAAEIGDEADALTLDLAAAESAGTDTRSAWSTRRAQIARADVAMRSRVGRMGDRLNVRRHAGT